MKTPKYIKCYVDTSKIVQTRLCKTCKTEKPLWDFYLKNRLHCKKCVCQNVKESLLKKSPKNVLEGSFKHVSRVLGKKDITNKNFISEDADD